MSQTGRVDCSKPNFSQPYAHCGYLLPVGALVCMACAKDMPGVENWSEAVYANWPEIAIDNADCDRCGERMLPDA